MLVKQQQYNGRNRKTKDMMTCEAFTM